MDDIYELLKSHPVAYVTRDIERAVALEAKEGYFIISNKSPSAEKTRLQYPQNVLLIEREAPLDTSLLLSLPEVRDFIKTKEAKIVVFKNTSVIEKICAENELDLLNPSAELAAQVEEKITQVAWLGELASFLPKHEILQCKDLHFGGKPFVIQFNHAHSGEGTLLIRSEADLAPLRSRFPSRLVRKTSYVSGPIFTNNNVTAENHTICGNISYQITGLPPFTDLPFTTIGNDWGLPKKILSKSQRTEFLDMAKRIGEKLRGDGWKGLFGIDVVLDEKTGMLHLLEINARQPASASFESILQKKATPTGATIFEEHLRALIGKSAGALLSEIRNGAQIIQRRTEAWEIYEPRQESHDLETAGYYVWSYPYNKERNSEQMRVQSKESIMKGHSVLNSNGENIIARLPLSRLSIKEVREQTRLLIDQYLHLPPKGIPCPYFNNKHAGSRLALKARAGKGMPAEILEEMEIILKKSRVSEDELSSENFTKIMVEHGIGIDCSGLLYHLLDEESRARGFGAIRNFLHFPFVSLLYRPIIKIMRPITNADVRTFAHDKNSRDVTTEDVLPGDFISMIDGTEQTRNHILFINKVQYEKGIPTRLFYIHALAAPEDGLYGHGVREGEIKITDISLPLTKQKWKDGAGGNYTLKRALKSKVSLKRLRLFEQKAKKH